MEYIKAHCHSSDKEIVLSLLCKVVLKSNLNHISVIKWRTNCLTFPLYAFKHDVFLSFYEQQQLPYFKICDLCAIDNEECFSLTPSHPVPNATIGSTEGVISGTYFWTGWTEISNGYDQLNTHHVHWDSSSRIFLPN